MKKLLTFLVALLALFSTRVEAGSLLLNTGTNVPTFLATPSSANLVAALTDETGTGAAVFAAAPTLTGDVTETYSNGFLHLSNSSTGVAGIKWETSGTLESSLLQTGSSGLLALNAGRGAAWGGSITIATDTTTRLTITTTLITSTLPVRFPSYTVAGLPAASIGAGSRAFATDALAPTFGATVVGGGAVFIPVYSDGTNWKVG